MIIDKEMMREIEERIKQVLEDEYGWDFEQPDYDEEEPTPSDLKIKRIKELFPERMTYAPVFPREENDDYRVIDGRVTDVYIERASGGVTLHLKDAYNRLADLEDIIYGDD